MLTESKIDKSVLKTVILKKLGIRIINFTLVPRWEAVRAYIVEGSDHEKFFLKMYRDNSVPDSAFRFSYDLFAKAGIWNIAHPIPSSNGQIHLQIGDFHIALFNLISGKTAEEQKLTNGQLERLGQLLARIHQSKTIIGEYSLRENFEIPFKDVIVAIFNEMSKITGNSTKFENRLKFFLEPYRRRFLRELETLEELQRRVRALSLEFVNCHGEPSPGNVMSSDDGEIHLIDWDEPIFAPKEKDLLFFKDHLQPVMKGYSVYSQDKAINQDLIEFYGHKWNLGEIADYGSRILFENYDDKQNQIWLDNLKGGWDFTF